MPSPGPTPQHKNSCRISKSKLPHPSRSQRETLPALLFFFQAPFIARNSEKVVRKEETEQMILSQRHLCVDTTVQHCSPHSPSCSFHKSVSAVSFPRRCIATLPSLPLTHFAHSENPPTLGDQGMGKIRDRKRQCDSLFPQLFSASIRPRTSCSFFADDPSGEDGSLFPSIPPTPRPTAGKASF